MTPGHARFEEIWEQFDREGYVVLRGLFPAAVVTAVREELARIVDDEARRLLEAGKIRDPCAHEPVETRLARLYAQAMDVPLKNFLRSEVHRPAFYRLFFNPEILDLVHPRLGPEIRLYPNYTIQPKLPGWANGVYAWHQDGGYTFHYQKGGYTPDDVNSQRMVNVWTSFVPSVEQNGCLCYIPRSHRRGLLPHVLVGTMLEVAEDLLRPLLPSAVTVETDPGDAVLFHNLVIHGSLPNRSAGVRWSASFRYQDATQPTLRRMEGYLASSKARPRDVVGSAEEWARLPHAESLESSSTRLVRKD